MRGTRPRPPTTPRPARPATTRRRRCTTPWVKGRDRLARGVWRRGAAARGLCGTDARGCHLAVGLWRSGGGGADAGAPADAARPPRRPRARHRARHPLDGAPGPADGPAGRGARGPRAHRGVGRAQHRPRSAGQRLLPRRPVGRELAPGGPAGRPRRPAPPLRPPPNSTVAEEARPRRSRGPRRSGIPGKSPDPSAPGEG